MADVGFIFRRWAKPVLWMNGSAAWAAVPIVGWPADRRLLQDPANTDLIGDVHDDSTPTYQDTNPDLHEDTTVIVDNDGPGYPLAPLPGDLSQAGTSPGDFRHYRAGFVQYVVFKAGRGVVPQRVSAVYQWGVSMDYGRGTDNRAVFVLRPPNSGRPEDAVVNDIVMGADLPDYGLHLQAPVLGTAELLKPDGTAQPLGDTPAVLRRGRTARVRVRGRHLIGVLETLIVDARVLPARWDADPVVHAVELVSDATGVFSPAEEAIVSFVPNMLVSSECPGSACVYSLQLRNSAGASGPIGRFLLVE